MSPLMSVRQSLTRLVGRALAAALLGTLLFWVALAIMAQRGFPWRTVSALSGILTAALLAVLLAVHLPLLLAIRRRSRPGRGLVPAILLGVALSPLPLVVVFLLFRESGDTLFPLSRVVVMEAVPWLVGGAGAGAAFGAASARTGLS